VIVGSVVSSAQIHRFIYRSIIDLAVVIGVRARFAGFGNVDFTIATGALRPQDWLRFVKIHCDVTCFRHTHIEIGFVLSRRRCFSASVLAAVVLLESNEHESR
jgi:hypothetical protein